MRRLAVLTVAVLLLGSTPASAGVASAPCRTTTYRHHVVNVLGTSEELLSATDGAFKALKAGHVRVARQTLRSVHDYLPTYFDREGRLVKLTMGCGT